MTRYFDPEYDGTDPDVRGGGVAKEGSGSYGVKPTVSDTRRGRPGSGGT